MGIYLETSSTTVSWNQGKLSQVYYDGLTTGSLNTRQTIGAEITLVISDNKINPVWMTSCSTKC